MMKIKVEKDLEKDLVFEEGDVVLAKCQDSFPWPGKISCFRGYVRGYVQGDEEVYRVEFVDDNWAFLKHSQLAILSYSIINQLKEIHAKDKNFIKALHKAKCLLNKMDSTLHGIMRIRFQEVYKSDNLIDLEFFNNNIPQKRPTGYLQPKKDNLRWHKLKKLKYVQYMNGSITIISKDDQNISICINFDDNIISYVQKRLFQTKKLEYLSIPGIVRDEIGQSCRDEVMSTTSTAATCFPESFKDILSEDCFKQGQNIAKSIKQKQILSIDKLLSLLLGKIDLFKIHLINYRTYGGSRNEIISQLGLQKEKEQVIELIRKIRSGFSFAAIMNTPLITNVINLLSIFNRSDYIFHIKTSIQIGLNKSKKARMVKADPILSLCKCMSKMIEIWLKDIRNVLESKQMNNQKLALQLLQSSLLLCKQEYQKVVEELQEFLTE